MTPQALTEARNSSQALSQEQSAPTSTSAGEGATDVFNRGVFLAIRERPAQWLGGATAALNNLLKLQEGWDTYGAKRVSRESVAAARLILIDLSYVDTINVPAITADPDGLVSLAWGLRHGSLDADIRGDGVIEYVYLDLDDPRNEVEAETTDPLVLAALLTRW